MFVVLIVLYSISVVFYSQNSVNINKLSIVTIVVISLPYIFSLIISSILSVFKSSNFSITFKRSLNYTNIIIGVILLSVSTFRILMINGYLDSNKSEITKTNKQSKFLRLGDSLYSKLKNWRSTEICRKISPKKEIAILPIFTKLEKYSILTGVEILNCTETTQALTDKTSNSMFYLEAKNDKSWKILWDLSKYMIRDKRSWVIKPNESWYLDGFQYLKIENMNEYRFSLVVNSNSMYSNVFKINLAALDSNKKSK